MSLKDALYFEYDLRIVDLGDDATENDLGALGLRSW
jgi:hypothetical protein